LHVRTSCVVVPHKLKEDFFDDNSINWFEDETVIALKQSEKLKNLREIHNKKLILIKSSIASYDKEISKTFEGFNLVNKWSKLLDKLNDIEQLVDKQWSLKINQSTDLKKVLNIKKRYFNSLEIQERRDHFGMHVELFNSKLDFIQHVFGFSASQRVWVIFS
jgi:hypothetical protein